MRGMKQEEIFSHDVLIICPIFDGNMTTKPQKAQLVTELEKHLTNEDK